MASRAGAADTSRAALREIVRRLNAALGQTLVAALAGSQDATASHGWAKWDGPCPSEGQVERLMFAYEQWQKVADAEGMQVARAWFVGANPWLQNDSPINAIRMGRLRDVSSAARALIDDSFGG